MSAGPKRVSYERVSFERPSDGAQASTSTTSPQLNRQPTILRVPGKTDIFDQEGFDATKFINQLYPDESSLTDLDRFIMVLKKQIQQVDQEIFNAVRSQGGAHTRARQDLSVAHSQIQELFGKIHEIQRKAEESEEMVQEICRDIKKLDYAKRHLTNSITALRRLAMLTAAVTDLEAVCDRRDQYRKCANLVEAVHQLMEYFEQYKAIPKVRSLARRLAAVEQKLQAAVLDDFKILMGGPADDKTKLAPENLDRLANACLVVDALGPKVHDMLMDWLCDREMTIYQTAFGGVGVSGGAATSSPTGSPGPGPSPDGGRLDSFEKRFVWFRSRLAEKKDTWSLFPAHWRVPQVLCLTFCKITKAHLKRILSDDQALAAQLREGVAPLIVNVVATNRFERDMAQLFGGGHAGGIAGSVAGASEDGDDESEAAGDNMTASEARKRLEKFRAKVKAEQQAAQAAKDGVPRAGDRAREAQEEAIKVAFEGAVSEAFEGALVQFYVGEEEREHLDHLDTCIREEHERKWMPEGDEDDPASIRVLPSANKIFFKIRSSLTRCSKNVSRGPTLVALAQLFKRVLSGYAQELMRRLPKTTTGATSAVPAVVGGSTDWYIRLSDEEEKVVCCLLATAEFCRETVEGLAGALAKDVKPQLADRVDFSSEENAFVSVTSACMSVLVLGINTRLDGGLVDMLRGRWDAVEQPGDDSGFVGIIRKVLLDCAPRLGSCLDHANMSFLCDKIARMFVPRLHEALFRLRRISDKGCLQLAIDVDAVRRILLDFPRVAASGEEQEMPAFVAYVEREMGSVLNLVKVVQSKPEALVDTYLLLMPPQAQSLMEFQRLCDLKALTRKQQQDLMAVYQLKAAQASAGGAAAAAAAGAASGASAAAAAGGAVAAPPPLPVPAAAALGTFKLSMNNFTRELASSMPFGVKRQDTGLVPSSPAAAAAAAKGGLFAKPSPGHVRGVSSDALSASSGSNFLKDTAAKTKEGFAKIGNLIRVANTLGSEHSHHGSET